MTEELIIAGFGGQGILSMGRMLAYAGIMQGLEVSWMPSYGPEMRGGTANVTVILSDTKISSPVLSTFDTGIILSQQALDKFEKTIRPGGVIIYDPNGITSPPTRTDLLLIPIEATSEAAKNSMNRVFNMILIGAYIQIIPLINFENALSALHKFLPQRHHQLIPLNEKAIRMGVELAKKSKLKL